MFSMPRLQDSELALLQDMSHLQAIKQDLAAVTTNRHRLPDKSVQVVEVGKGRGKEGGEGREVPGMRGPEYTAGVCVPACPVASVGPPLCCRA